MAGLISKQRARVLTAAVLALAAVSAAGMPALAHANLVSSSPDAHSQLSGNPPYVDLRFSSPVIGAQQVQVHDAGGRPAAVGRTETLDGGRRIRARLPTLGAGDYVVDWRALSADGHLSLGRYGFSVGVADRQVGSSAGTFPALEAGVRWVYLIALLVAYGSLVTRRLAWSRIRLSAGRELPLVPLAPVLTVAVFGAMAQAALVMRRAGLDAGQLPVRLALLQAAMVLASLWLATRNPRPRLLLGSLTVAVVVAALAGHAATSAHWWGGPANSVHLLAVALWTGGLAQLALAGWTLRARADLPVLLDGARRYARLALISVVMAIITGLLSAAAEFGSVQQLVGSGYGRVLVVKVALVGVTLALATGARLLGIPSHRAARPRLLRRLVRAESAVLVAVVAAAALLANTAPPQTAVAAAEQVPLPVLNGPVVEQADFDGRFLVRLRVSGDTIVVQLLDATGRAPRGARIDVFTVTPDYDDLNVYPRSCGDACATGDYPLQPGSTALLVVSRAQGKETTVAFAVHWPVMAADPMAIRSLRDRLAALPRVSVTQQQTGAGGTEPLPRLQPSGAGAAQVLGLEDPTLRPLAYQPRADQVLASDAAGDFYELDVSADGMLTHEVVTNSRGRVERALGP